MGSIKEEIEKPNISIEYCHTTFQAADIFTKGLAPLKWPNALQLLGIKTEVSFAKAAVALPTYIREYFSGPRAHASQPRVPESELEREVKTDQDVSTFKADRGIYAACSVIDDVVEQLAVEYSEESTYNGLHLSLIHI